MKKKDSPAEVPAKKLEKMAAAPEERPVGDADAPSAPETSQTGTQAIVRAPQGLNLRAGPGSGFEVGAVLPDGAGVSVLKLLAEGGPQGAFEVQIPGWKYVFTGQMTGWVDASFLLVAEHAQP